ncbi:MAG: DUF4291 domain-containing protein [Polyangiaceae bacterium]|nr:DUF4291 domain-containing protein [Polyangiaceae bacterium]
MLPRSLLVASYLEQAPRWPTSGRHLMAQSSERSVVVYQAYRPSIGRWAAEHRRLGGDGFSFDRMSWIKPNFLWMMFRSGWGTKEAQEVTLAIHVAREGFERILAEAVPSSFSPELFESPEHWRGALARSEVRLQWDPDHLPGGEKSERRAIQLGLRGKTLRSLVEEWTLDIEDISPFVAAQRPLAPPTAAS